VAPEEVWQSAIARVDAEAVEEGSGAGQGAPAAFDSALGRLTERQLDRMHGLHTAAVRAQTSALSALEQVEASQDLWRELAQSARRWLETASAATEALHSSREEISATRGALEERAKTLKRGEAELQAKLQAVTLRLAELADVQSRLHDEGADLERLERVITMLSRGDDWESGRERLGEARGIVSQLASARAEQTVELSRVRDRLEDAARVRGPELVEAPISDSLERALGHLAVLTKSWGDHALRLRRSATGGTVDLSRLDDSRAELRRGIEQLEALRTASGQPGRIEDQLVRRLMEQQLQIELETAEHGITEETRRLLEEIDAKTSEIQTRLDRLASRALGVLAASDDLE